MHLKGLGIGAAGTVKHAVSHVYTHFNEGLKPAHAKLADWGTLQGVLMQEKVKAGEPQVPALSDGIILFNWKDAACVFFMSTIYTGKGFILRLRRRYRQVSGAMPSTKVPFNFQADLLDQPQAQSYFVNRVMLLIPLFIDDYNHRINAVNLAD